MRPITVPYPGWSCSNLPAEDSRWTRPGLPTKNKTLFINNNSSLLTLKMPESKLPMLTMEQQCSLVPPHTFTLIWPDNGPGWLGWLRLTEGDWVWLGWLRLTGVTEGPSLRLTEADWGWLRVNEDDWGFNLGGSCHSPGRWRWGWRASQSCPGHSRPGLADGVE